MIYSYPNGRTLKLKFEAEEERVFLAGRTGCGKSTLLRILNGLIPEFYGGKLEGTVSIYGRRGNPGDVYLVTQHPEEQIVCNSVIEEVAFSLVQKGVEWSEARRRAEEALEKTGGIYLANRDTSNLSDGEKQLVIVSAAIASESKCLAFDEPFAHLHPKIAEKVLDCILHDERTSIVSEHRLELSGNFDRVYWIGDTSNSGMMIGEVKCCNCARICDRCDEGSEVMGVRKTLVRAKDASVFRGKKLVADGINFRLREGEVAAVTGLNGSGKTTLLRCVAGLEKSRGLEVRGKPFMSFQYPGYTLNSGKVGEEVPYWLLKEFGLEKYRDRHPHSLSSGERRMLSALKAFRGKVILLDEPTAGLDRNLRLNFIHKLIYLIKKSGKCALIATHDMEVAEMCDFSIAL